MPRYRVTEHHAYTLTFDVEAPTAHEAVEIAKTLSADEGDEEELGTQRVTVEMQGGGIALIEEGATTDEQYIAWARQKYHRDGQVEIDDNAVVSRGEDPGAYVAAWCWVNNRATPEED